MTSNKLPCVPKRTVALHCEQTQVLLGLKKPKIKRKLETKPRKAYNREEDRIRTEIIKVLRKNGCTVFRLEPSTRGKWGVSDLLVFTNRSKMIFMEVKTESGKLSDDQCDFLKLCLLCGQMYITVISAQDALQVIKYL